jgi:hypothetical protein
MYLKHILKSLDKTAHNSCIYEPLRGKDKSKGKSLILQTRQQHQKNTPIHTSDLLLENLLAVVVGGDANNGKWNIRQFHNTKYALG